MAQLADFKGLHYGESMVVCGLGHSVSSFKRPEWFRTIGVNDIGRAFQPTYLLVMDNPASFGPERFRFIRESRAQYLFTDQGLGFERETMVRCPIRKSDRPELDDPNALYYIGRPSTSPFLALCLAAHMGAKAIGLIGVDFTNNHFFATDGPHKLRPSLLGINKRFCVLGAALLERGVKVFNLSAESKISAFPRLTVEQFYQLQSSGRSRAWTRPARRLCLVSQSAVDKNTAAVARLINTETSLSCRLISPNSTDIKTGATPEVEELVLANTHRKVDCEAAGLSRAFTSEREFGNTWTESLRPVLLGDSDEMRSNGHAARPSVTAIVSQADATGEELAETVASLWPDLSERDELVVIARSRQENIPLWLRTSAQIGFFEPEDGESSVDTRNRAAALASKDILLFTDANTQAPEHWAATLTYAFRDIRVAAAGPAVANMYHPESKGFGMRWVDAELNTTWLPRKKESIHVVPLLSGVFLAIRRSMFGHTGGFDPAMPQGGGEDLELCYRFWCSGWKCVVHPGVEVQSLNRYQEGAVRASQYWDDLLHNLLRLAAIHFSKERVEAFIALRGNDPAFPGACTRLMRGDAQARHAQFAHLSGKQEKWFFKEAG